MRRGATASSPGYCPRPFWCPAAGGRRPLAIPPAPPPRAGTPDDSAAPPAGFCARSPLRPPGRLLFLAVGLPRRRSSRPRALATRVGVAHRSRHQPAVPSAPNLATTDGTGVIDTSARRSEQAVWTWRWQRWRKGRVVAATARAVDGLGTAANPSSLGIG